MLENSLKVPSKVHVLDNQTISRTGTCYSEIKNLEEKNLYSILTLGIFTQTILGIDLSFHPQTDRENGAGCSQRSFYDRSCCKAAHRTRLPPRHKVTMKTKPERECVYVCARARARR